MIVSAVWTFWQREKKIFDWLDQTRSPIILSVTSLASHCLRVVTDLLREEESRTEMRPMTDLEPVTEVRDMEESSVDAASNLKEQAERDEKEAEENRIEKRPRAHTLCKLYMYLSVLSLWPDPWARIKVWIIFHEFQKWNRFYEFLKWKFLLLVFCYLFVMIHIVMDVSFISFLLHYFIIEDFGVI